MTSIPGFSVIHDRAVANKGAERLRGLLPEVKGAARLARIPDDRWLAEMARRVFCAGFIWSVVDAKWADFETVFFGFDPDAVAMMSDEVLGDLTTDARIIRHYKKILSIRDNALFVREIRDEFGGFGAFVGEWPQSEIVDLWGVLHKRGSRLGGNTRQYFLRFMGKDTFILTQDVIACLNHHGIIDQPAVTSQRDLAFVQSVFNEWHDETGLPLSHLSRIAACSLDA